MRRIAITCLLILSAFATSATGGVVHRRGGLDAIRAPIIAIDEAGVLVRGRDDSTRLIAWDVIRDIEPDSPDLTLQRKLRVARDLWRARSRVQRNDPTLAEPLFERLFAQYRGRTSETARIVAEGLLRCRLARGAHESAVIPYLETLRLDRSQITTDRYDMLPLVFDRETELCPHLAPIWADVGILGKLQRDLEAYDPQGDEVVEAFSVLYAWAAGAQAGGLHDLESFSVSTVPNHEGLELLRLTLQVELEDEDSRVAARQRLLTVVQKMPEWTEAWARLFVGTSLLLESDTTRRRQGMVNLAHLPARFWGTHPYLTGLAMARLALELEAIGQGPQAQAIRAELVRRLPGHPILFANDPPSETSEKKNKDSA